MVGVPRWLGARCVDTKTVGYTWDSKVLDFKGMPSRIPCNVVEGSAALLVSLHIMRNAEIFNRVVMSYLAFGDLRTLTSKFVRNISESTCIVMKGLE